ncbi:MAG: ribosome recycling factor [Acidiferrobacter sp.]
MSDDVKKEVQARMAKSLEALKQELARIRTGRANTALLDHILVDYYGTKSPLSKVANVTVSDARNLVVNPWEKALVAPIERAILESGLGFNPVTTGTTIRIPMPSLTEERRRDLGKVARSEGENAKIAVRNIRRDSNNHLKEQVKKKLLSEDEEKRLVEAVQKTTDQFIAEIDKLVGAKERDILEI